MKSFVYLSFLLSGLSYSFAESESNKSLMLSNENIEVFFPSLSKIFLNLNESAPSISESEQFTKITRSNKIIAEASKGVSVNFNVSGLSIHENRPGQSYDQSFRTVGSIYVKKPVYHWGGLKAKSRIAELKDEYAVQQTIASKANLIMQIKSAFMDLVLLNFKLDLAKDALSICEENEEDLVKRKELGIATELMVSQATIEKLEQSIEIAEFNRLLITQKAFFKHDTGFYDKIVFDIPEKFETFYNKHEFGKGIPQLLGSISSQTVEELKSQINIEKENIKIADSNLKPKVNLVGGFYQDQIDLPNKAESVRRNNFLVGVEANWALWDSSHSKGMRSLALAKKRQFEIQLESNTKRLRLEMNGLQAQMFNLAKQIDLARQLVSTANNRFEKSQIEFDINQITHTIYFSSKLDLSKARLSLIQTVFAYFQVKEKYEFHLQYPK
ncbi:MAG: TolC family protein [Opitutales bacterium]|nr:TolC family protein [Opitutales bacterium]MDG1324760.1 TolC family protein [Opitutales bacterium]